MNKRAVAAESTLYESRKSEMLARVDLQLKAELALQLQTSNVKLRAEAAQAKEMEEQSGRRAATAMRFGGLQLRHWPGLQRRATLMPLLE